MVVSPSGSTLSSKYGIRESKEALAELKTKLEFALSRLNDQDTQRTGIEEIREFLQTLYPDWFPMVITCIGEAGTNLKPLGRCESVKLLGLLAELHGDAVIPLLQRMLQVVLTRLQDADLHLREACAETVFRLTRSLVVDADGSPVFATLLKPLFAALSEHNKWVQIGAASCICAVIQGSPPAILSENMGRLSSRLVQHLSLPLAMARPQLLSACIHTMQAVSLPEFDEVLPSLMPCLELCLNSTADWQTRKQAVEVLQAIGDHPELGQSLQIPAPTDASARPTPLQKKLSAMMDGLREDKVRAVREAAKDVLVKWCITAKAPTLSPGEKPEKPMRSTSPCPAQGDRGERGERERAESQPVPDFVVKAPTRTSPSARSTSPGPASMEREQARLSDAGRKARDAPALRAREQLNQTLEESHDRPSDAAAEKAARKIAIKNAVSNADLGSTKKPRPKRERVSIFSQQANSSFFQQASQPNTSSGMDEVEDVVVMPTPEDRQSCEGSLDGSTPAGARAAEDVCQVPKGSLPDENPEDPQSCEGSLDGSTPAGARNPAEEDLRGRPKAQEPEDLVVQRRPPARDQQEQEDYVVQRRPPARDQQEPLEDFVVQRRPARDPQEQLENHGDRRRPSRDQEIEDRLVHRGRPAAQREDDGSKSPIPANEDRRDSVQAADFEGEEAISPEVSPGPRQRQKATFAKREARRPLRPRKPEANEAGSASPAAASWTWEEPSRSLPDAFPSPASQRFERRDEELEAVMGQVQQMAGRLQALEEEKTRSERRMTERLQQLAKTCDGQGQLLSAQQERLDAQEQQIKDLEERLAQNEDDLTQMDQQLQEQQLQLQQQDQRLEQDDQQLNEHQQQLEQQEQELEKQMALLTDAMVHSNSAVSTGSRPKAWADREDEDRASNTTGTGTMKRWSSETWKPEARVSTPSPATDGAVGSGGALAGSSSERPLALGRGKVDAPAKPPKVGLWDSVLELCTERRFLEAYKQVIAEPEETCLLRLMKHTGPIVDRLDAESNSRLIRRLIHILSSPAKEPAAGSIEQIFSWLWQALNQGIHFTASQVEDLVAALQKVSSAQSPLSSSEKAEAAQLLQQVSTHRR
ncbi:unnamed protein product [Effrenium voratum]|nr:unnamed protein product [Effrenium voratum]